MEEEKVYIFVSHSHRDIDKVRLVRNYLEEKGAEPILFFLKSVTDDNEVADLIKREIDARLWFLYCRSRNAENSNWVRTELDYVKKTGKKNFFEIDLDRDLSFAAKEGGAGAAALTEKVARRLDACIDEFIADYGGSVDYVHGNEQLKALSAEGCGIVVPGIPRDRLFKEIVSGGNLPRKTFSLGDGNEKRYYIEARAIK